MTNKIFALLAMVFFTSTARAEELCYVEYEQFELAVPHVDAMVCPDKNLSISDYFCRIAISGEKATLYTFQFVGDNACLIDAEEMTFREFRDRYGATYQWDY